SGGMGFVQPTDKREERLDEKVERTAAAAATKKFSPEFMNRLDKVVVFHPLRLQELTQILEIELGMVQQRVLETPRGQFLFRVTKAAREFLLRDGTDLKYGARHLKRTIERHVVYPLANLLATEQVRLGDILCVDWDAERSRLIFAREAEDAAIPRFPRHRVLPAARAPQSRRAEQRPDARTETRVYAELPEPSLSH
ncbi:MAG: hypothetical protein WBF35_07500, partial [Candidatus Acidiferrales bacterium]